MSYVDSTKFNIGCQISRNVDMTKFYIGRQISRMCRIKLINADRGEKLNSFPYLDLFPSYGGSSYVAHFPSSGAILCSF